MMTQGCSPAKHIPFILTLGAQLAVCAAIPRSTDSDCSAHPYVLANIVCNTADGQFRASEVPCPSKHVSSLTLLAAIGIPGSRCFLFLTRRDDSHTHAVLIVVIAIGGYAFHVFRRASGGRSNNKVYDTVPPSSTALLQTTSTKSMGSLEDGLSPSYSDTSSDFGRTKDDAASPQVRELSTPETARTMYGYGVGVI